MVPYKKPGAMAYPPPTGHPPLPSQPMAVVEQTPPMYVFHGQGVGAQKQQQKQPLAAPASQPTNNFVPLLKFEHYHQSSRQPIDLGTQGNPPPCATPYAQTGPIPNTVDPRKAPAPFYGQPQVHAIQQTEHDRHLRNYRVVQQYEEKLMLEIEVARARLSQFKTFRDKIPAQENRVLFYESMAEFVDSRLPTEQEARLALATDLKGELQKFRLTFAGGLDSVVQGVKEQTYTGSVIRDLEAEVKALIDTTRVNGSK